MLRGTHNESNALAALALTEKLNVDRRGGRRVARFGLPHRSQLVAERRGVAYIDDSKGDVGATLAALNGFAGPLVLIAEAWARPGHGAARVRRASAPRC